MADEEAAVQKQVGCMNGFLHLFDPHHFLSARLIPPKPGQVNEHEKQAETGSRRTPEKILKSGSKDKRRSSTESPRTSFSSSPRSSSFSSAETNSRASSNQTIVHQPPSHHHIHGHTVPNALAPSPLNQQTFDFHDVVKGSLSREVPGLVVKTAIKEEAGRHTFKHIDSPRPLHTPKSAKARVCSQHSNSSFQEPFQIMNERVDGPLNRRPKDAARYSHDGRMSHDSPKLKIKELPRLSLDSKESSLNASIKCSKNNMLRDLHILKLQTMDTEQEPASYRGPSTVIARLMGLEAFPDSTVANSDTCTEVKNEPSSQALRTDEKKQNYPYGSTGQEFKQSSRKNTDAVRKPITTKCQNEPAPWKQQDVCTSLAPGSKCQETVTKAPSATVTVYGEIEKRLAQLEFKRSGKDLRALKQILEAMQKTKQNLDGRYEDDVSDITPTTRTFSRLEQSSESAGRDLETNDASPGKFMLSKSNCPIVIVKPTKFLEMASNSKQLTVATKSFSRQWQNECATSEAEKVGKQLGFELTTRPNHLRVRPSQSHPVEKSLDRTPRSYQTSREPTTPVKEKTGTNKGSEDRTKRMQHKKLGSEKSSNCKSPRSDPSRQSRQPSRQQTDSTSPCRKSSHRSPRLHHNDSQQRDFSSKVREFSHQGDNSSIRSDSNISSTSIVEDEVTSTSRSCKTGRIYQQNATKQNEERSIGDSIQQQLKIAPEQPSPISVLDATFSGDESPSPVKKISHSLKDGALNPFEAEWSFTILDDLPSCSHKSQQDHIVEGAGHLIQNLRETEFREQESMIHETTPTSNCPNQDPEYIMEILLASGLLQDLESAYLTLHHRSSGQLVNPELFFTLEKMKASDLKHRGRKVNQFESVDKVHRKLVFDAVNEILPRTLGESYGKQGLPLNMASGKQQRGQQLIRKICSEVDHLQASNSNCEEDDNGLSSILWQDLMHGSSEWTDSPSETPWIALNVERLIFKDLINEVVTGEAVHPPRQSGGYCRQLFSTSA